MYSFRVRIKTDDLTVMEQPVDLSTLIEWRDKGYISPGDEVWSEYFTGGQWKKLGEVNLAGSVETGRRVAQTQTPAALSTGTTRFCSNCGASLSAGVSYCGSCGTKVVSIPDGVMHARAEPLTSSESPAGRNRCQYCGQEMASSATKCPSCNTWTPEINKTQTQFITLIAIGLLLTLLFIMMVVKFGIEYDLWKGKQLNLGKALSNPLVIVLLIGLVICIVAGEIVEAKLKRMKKGKLF